MQSNELQEITLIDIAPYIRAVWKYKWLIIAFLAISISITLALHLQEKPSYLATAHIRIGKVWNDPVGDPNVIAELVTKAPFLLKLNERLPKKSNINSLSQAITAEKLEAGKGRARYVYLIKLTARAKQPEKAQELVKATAEQVIAESNLVFDAAYSAYDKREKEQEAKLAELKNKISQPNITPTELYEKRLELQLLEQELFDIKNNNQSVLKTFRTSLAEEIEPAQQIPGSNIYKKLLIAIGLSFAIGVLISLTLEFGWPMLKEIRRN
jgi:LPS O-antigen subunit length determinant protein (WzzB/FepE family)